MPKDKVKTKSFPITAAKIKKNNLEAHCMKCKEKRVPKDVEIFIYKRRAGENARITARLGGICTECGTKVSRMMSKDDAIKIVKE